MTAPICLVCGVRAVHGHHATGSAEGGHLDPELTMRVCQAHHDEIHGLLRGLGMDRPADLLEGPAPVARVELRLRRVAVTLDVLGFGLFASQQPWLAAIGLFLIGLGAACEAWAAELATWLISLKET
jgi:hypothetical protein